MKSCKLKKRKDRYIPILYEVIESYPPKSEILKKELLKAFNEKLPPTFRLTTYQFARIFLYGKKYRVYKNSSTEGMKYIFVINKRWKGIY